MKLQNNKYKRLGGGGRALCWRKSLKKSRNNLFRHRGVGVFIAALSIIVAPLVFNPTQAEYTENEPLSINLPIEVRLTDKDGKNLPMYDGQFSLGRDFFCNYGGISSVGGAVGASRNVATASVVARSADPCLGHYGGRYRTDLITNKSNGALTNSVQIPWRNKSGYDINTFLHDANNLDLYNHNDIMDRVSDYAVRFEAPETFTDNQGRSFVGLWGTVSDRESFGDGTIWKPIVSFYYSDADSALAMSKIKDKLYNSVGGGGSGFHLDRRIVAAQNGFYFTLINDDYDNDMVFNEDGTALRINLVYNGNQPYDEFYASKTAQNKDTTKNSTNGSDTSGNSKSNSVNVDKFEKQPKKSKKINPQIKLLPPNTGKNL